MAASDAKAIPTRNVALRLTAPLFDADGDLVAGATGLDSEVSKDGGTFVDCTNEATQIATGSGIYFLDLTATEMDADTVAIIVKTSSVGAKTTPIVLYTSGIRSDSLAANTIDASALSSGAGTEIADAVLSRALSNVEGTAVFRSLAGAVAKLVDKVAIAGGTLTVYKTDDTTAYGTQAVTTDAAANPITAVDTV